MCHQVVGVLQCLVEARSGRGSPAVDGKDGSRPVHLATGYHQEVGVLQLDDKDGSRPRHLAAASTSGGQCAAVPGRGLLALAKL